MPASFEWFFDNESSDVMFFFCEILICVLFGNGMLKIREPNSYLNLETAFAVAASGCWS